MRKKILKSIVQEHFSLQLVEYNFPRYGVYTAKQKLFKVIHFSLLPANSNDKIL